jgi:transposase
MSVKPSQPPSPGMPCPNCNFFIEMSIYSLLSQSQFKCPGCLLTLNMDRNQSKSALELLQKVNVQQENIQKHKRFSL